MKSIKLKTSEEVMKVLEKQFHNITEIKHIFKNPGDMISMIYNDGKKVAFVERVRKEGFILNYWN